MTPVPYFLLSLLWLAHGLVDRLGLSEQRARASGSPALWAAHAGQLTLLAAALLLFGATRLRFSSQPMPPSLVELAFLALSFGLLHLLVDLAQRRASGGDPSPRSEALDQIAHLVLTAGAVLALGLRHPEWSQLGSGPILILGQPVELTRFAGGAVAVGLLLWITGAAIRPQLPPRLQAALAAERILGMIFVLSGPLWLAGLLLVGRAAWSKWRSEPARQAAPSLCLLLLAVIFRGLQP